MPEKAGVRTGAPPRCPSRAVGSRLLAEVTRGLSGQHAGERAVCVRVDRGEKMTQQSG